MREQEEGEVEDLSPLRHQPKQACDLVMKGGIASGVVYPDAIVELASEYRLASIGGTSAGAIAASLAAAAECGRKEGGFEKLKDIGKEIPKRMKSLFQATPKTRHFFEILLEMMEESGGALCLAFTFVAKVMSRYWWLSLGGALLGALIVVVADLAFFLLQNGRFAWSFHLDFDYLFFPLLAALAVNGWKLYAIVTQQLPRQDFGFCPGSSQAGYDAIQEPGLTNWLSSKLSWVAGLDPETHVLTFGDLGRSSGGAVKLQVLTTSLAEGRPYKLPFVTKRFFFKKSEFDRLFPENVVEYMIKNSEESTRTPGYYRFPVEEHLPVIVAVRMSLSFPILLCAVPLYACDYTFINDEEKKVLRRCVFSDGGISSNLPMHFFDAALPGHPTFAINLEDHDPARHGDELVGFPKAAGEGIQRRVQDVTKLGGFFGAVMDSAQNWQDNLKLTQPGNRGRVVTVRLKTGEGGLNLAMSSTQIEGLVLRGKEAGEKLRTQFDFSAHRWRRYLVWAGALEGEMRNVKRKFSPPVDYTNFLETYEPTEYKPNPKQEPEEWSRETRQRFFELVELYRRHDGELPGITRLRDFAEGPNPKPCPRITLDSPQ